MKLRKHGKMGWPRPEGGSQAGRGGDGVQDSVQGQSGGPGRWQASELSPHPPLLPSISLPFPTRSSPLPALSPGVCRGESWVGREYERLGQKKGEELVSVVGLLCACLISGSTKTGSGHYHLRRPLSSPFSKKPEIQIPM